MRLLGRARPPVPEFERDQWLNRAYAAVPAGAGIAPDCWTVGPERAVFGAIFDMDRARRTLAADPGTLVRGTVAGRRGPRFHSRAQRNAAIELFTTAQGQLGKTLQWAAESRYSAKARLTTGPGSVHDKIWDTAEFVSHAAVAIHGRPTLRPTWLCPPAGVDPLAYAAVSDAGYALFDIPKIVNRIDALAARCHKLAQLQDQRLRQLPNFMIPAELHVFAAVELSPSAVAPREELTRSEYSRFSEMLALLRRSAAAVEAGFDSARHAPTKHRCSVIETRLEVFDLHLRKLVV